MQPINPLRPIAAQGACGSQAHTHTRFSVLRITALIIAVMVCALYSRTAFANIVPLSGSFSETTIVSLTIGTNSDVVVNDNMLYNVTDGGYIKAVTWGVKNGNCTNYTSGSSAFYVEDNMGNNVTVSLPRNAVEPDIQLMYDPTSGLTDPYKVIVVYHVYGSLYIDLYDLLNVGTTSFSCSFNSSVNPTSTCDGVPHIDAWTDLGYFNPVPCSSCASVHAYAVVWADNNASNLQIYLDDIMSFGSSSPATVTTFAHMPDVACVTDISGAGVGTLTPKAIITYADAPSYSCSASSTTDLEVIEYDPSSGGSTSLMSTTGGTSTTYFYPRIDAIGEYDPSSPPGHCLWQVAVVKDLGVGGGVNAQVWGYNNIYPLGVNLSSTQFSGNHVMSPCVAAGMIPQTPITSGIGNYQYTVGMYPWQTDSLYTRDIAVTGTGLGSLIHATDWYLVNNSSVTYNWDLNKNMAVSNATNTGHDLLTAWYNGSAIVYKHSTPNVMAFRQATQGSSIHNTKPNLSATINGDQITLQGASRAPYRITDALGKLVATGTVPQDGRMNLESLASGSYVISVINGAGVSTATFSKY